MRWNDCGEAGRRRLGFGAVALVAGLPPLLVAALPPLVPADAATTIVRSAGSTTVWLCHPGLARDPCDYNGASTSVTGSGGTSVSPNPTPAASAKRFDCFYVYPTVSTEKTDNANLVVQPAEIAAAADQASRFSQVCNVWAPMYRQATTYALTHGLLSNPATTNIAYASLLAGWRDYVHHDNGGRPIIFIGHSQGAAMLIRLIRSQIDPSVRLRKQMVSAIILGGNVQVPVGRDVGGSFRHIPTCQSPSSTGCVIAYSTFGSTPPLLSLFGRPGRGVSLQSGQSRRLGQQVACVNPVTFSSGSGPLAPYFLAATMKVPGVPLSTPWVTFPGLYTAQCQSATGATWLQVTATPVAGDPRPTVTDALGALWGYHLDDVNLALGDLVRDVGSEEAAYR